MKKNSNWKSIQPRIQKLSQEKLIELIADLYGSCPQASLFIDGRFLKTSKSLKSYITKLKKVISADPMYGDDIDWVKAEHLINNYRTASGDDYGIAELLITFVKTANEFTLEYGDIDESYYVSMEEIFQKAANHLLKMDNEGMSIAPYVVRLKEIVDSTDGIGWGYHDALCDMYCEAFEKGQYVNHHNGY